MASKNINERVLDVELNCLKQQSKLKRFIHRHIPVTRWLPNYSRFYGVSDFIAGITLGLTMIPQSIAYAALAGLTPQYGLYSSFLGGFIYLIFGTIKEVSIGATSLMSLVTVEYTRDMPVDFVILLCFLAGCTELLMGLMNLGFLVDFISMSVTSGFTSATSIIIIMSQLPGLLGLRFKCENLTEGFKKLYQNWRKIRFNDSVLGVSCIIFLLAFRKLKDIDCSKIKSRNKSWGQLIQKTLWFLSISRNAITVCIASFITYNHYQNGSSIFITSGSVTPGLPSFNPPPFSSQVGNVTYNFLGMCSHLGSGIIMVPLVAVLTNVAIAKAYERDMITAGSTFLISIFINVESGLLFGTLINASFLLYLSARPSITIDKCKTVYGLEYVIVKPEIGLFYPAISYLTNKINRIARKEAKGIYPVVVDFNRLQGIDYTAAKGIQGILSDFEGKSQPLIFLNVNPNVVTSIIRLSGMKNFNAVCNEDDLIDTLKNLEITEKIYKAQDSSFKELLNKSSDFTSQNEITKESVLTERESLLTSYKPSELKSTDC
ncbi:sodium-independent sulfate anion transporter-like isoform X2 [Cotesia glomerata]|uniref:sodium-independent sulfate anion transporter-like isoform X2 n=1 Tax=Cotesia glomerata TaxID=32391 RepID=UPI001D016CD6|nr:sodium-independent sulfate anion transporter-like isoform X2 [Cotesia glomerata]